MSKHINLNEHRVALRSPRQVMRLSRLGSFHQSRLSFMRVLTRRLQCQQWLFDTFRFDVDQQGVGVAVYCAKGPHRTYSLIAFAHDLPDELRSDRVIAEQWDATFVLFDGVPTESDIKRLAANVPKQEGGRLSATELTLSRANRSVRLWKHVVDSLASGCQPDQQQLDAVGYLMRTTAVYGSGKFGAADRQSIADREECAEPFQVEMLTVYLIRAFVKDLVVHMAKVKGGERAVELDPAIARTLGIGNSTGLGMAPFILNHPVLFNNWIMAKEHSLALVRSIPKASPQDKDLFLELFNRAKRSMQQWVTDHEQQAQAVKELLLDLDILENYLVSFDFKAAHPWDGLYQWVEQNVKMEAQELVVSLLLEPYGELLDSVTHCMGTDEPNIASIDGSVSLSLLQEQLEKQYDWTLDINWADKDAIARAWYVSEEKLEPRLGERFEEPIGEYEQPLSPARDAMQMREAIKQFKPAATVAEFLLLYPEHRHTVRRIQTLQTLPYGEIRDNTISANLKPIDMLRCKLSFFGAIHFDPRSDRWVRIRMFANAPYPNELNELDADFWAYPVLTH